MRTRKVVVVSMVGALAGLMANAASAQEVNVQDLISPNTRSVEFGVIGAFEEPSWAGMYTGLNEFDAFPIASGTYIHRDEKTGTWTRVEGRNLGLSSRELSFERERQGDWKYFVDYDQIYKSNPLNFFTGLTGFTSNEQTVSGTSRREIELSTDRYNLTTGVSKRINGKLDVKIGYHGEYKNGERQFGSQGFNFLVDPVDYWVHEVDARVNYIDTRLQLTGGVLGSFFINKHDALYNDGNVTQVSLPLDNQAYRIYLNGGYNFTPDTRGTFKVDYSLYLQDEQFFRSPDFTGNNATDLGGEVHNILLQGGVSSRATKDLTLRAKLRFEDKRDETPTHQFITADQERTGFNIPFSRSRRNADLDGTYRLPNGYSLLGGFFYEGYMRSSPPRRQASFRDETDEVGGRLELRKRLTETLGGSVSYLVSSRDGDDFLNATTANAPNVIDAIHFSDRSRQQWKLNMDWSPTDKFSLQGRLAGSLDSYNSDQRRLGPAEGMSHDLSLDASYQINRDWTLTGFFSRNQITREQATISTADPFVGPWRADIDMTGYAGGIGVRGNVARNWKAGVDLQYSYDKSSFDLSVTDGKNLYELGDINYHRADIGVFAEHKLSQNGTLKMRYGLSYMNNNDWAYDNFVYADGTIVRIPHQEIAHFVGVSYKYDW